MKADTLKNEDSVIISEIFRKLALEYSRNDGTFRSVEVDIKVKTRKHPNLFYRHMYLNFASDILIKKNSETLASTASFLESDHATANHAVDLFKYEYSDPKFSYHKWFMKTYDFLKEETMLLYTKGKVDESLAELNMKAITKEELDVIQELEKLNESKDSKIKNLEDKVSQYSDIQISKDLENIRLREENMKLKSENMMLKSDNKTIKSEFSEIYNKYKKQNKIEI